MLLWNLVISWEATLGGPPRVAIGPYLKKYQRQKTKMYCTESYTWEKWAIRREGIFFKCNLTIWSVSLFFITVRERERERNTDGWKGDGLLCLTQHCLTFRSSFLLSPENKTEETVAFLVAYIMYGIQDAKPIPDKSHAWHLALHTYEPGLPGWLFEAKFEKFGLF